MRRQLGKLGIDPDKIGRAGRLPPRQEDLKHDQIVSELEHLREQLDSGAITQEEYDQARDRLRRY